MGSGDNKLTRKIRRSRAQKKKNEKLRKLIEQSQAGKK